MKERDSPKPRLREQALGTQEFSEVLSLPPASPQSPCTTKAKRYVLPRTRFPAFAPEPLEGESEIYYLFEDGSSVHGPSS